MPVNNVAGPGGFGDASPDRGDGLAITVRLGQNTLSDVARAHGLDPQELLKANPQIADPYQKLNAGQEISLPKNAGTAEGTTGGAGSATKNAGVPQMTGGQDIEALAFLAMMEASKSAQRDVQQVMNQAKAINTAKSEWRSAQDEINDLTGAPNAGGASTNANGGGSGSAGINDTLIAKLPGKDLPKP